MSNVCRLFCCLIATVCLVSRAEAAAPLTHLYLADLWCEIEHVTPAEKESFLRGSTFPDIHFIAEVPHEISDMPDVTYADIINAEDSFKKGCLLHAFVEQKRIEIAVENRVPAAIGDIAFGHTPVLLKLIEDEILFEACNSQAYQEIYARSSHEEVQQGVPESVVERWNLGLSSYLAQKPSELLAILAQEEQTFHKVEPKILETWSRAIPELVEHPDIQLYFSEMMGYFTDTFTGSDDL